MKIFLFLAAVWGLAEGQAFWALSKGMARIDPLVSTSKGLIRGLRVDSGDYSKFLGIPYALVDENNPFGPAVPHPGFEQIFEAYDDSIECVQKSSEGGFKGTIQCLNLNVYTPNKASSQNRFPVLVWIHGGGWVGGGPNIGPKHLVEKDVVVVSIAYRLGVYGFLCLDTPDVSGNQGLKDQVLALRWIKENIEAFGGDSRKITVFGSSTGGMSVNLHLYSDYEKLFDRAIIQSGTALSYWLMAPSDTTAALKITEHLGYNATDNSDAVSYLATVDPIAVTSAAYDLGLLADMGRAQSKIKPCIEKKFEEVDSFLTEHPMNIKQSSKVRSSSIIIGYTDYELGSIYGDDPSNYDNEIFKESFYLGFDENENLHEALEEIRHFYIGDEDINIGFSEDIGNYATDIIFAHPTQRMVEQFVEAGAKGVYRYVFSYTESSNETGATHGAEQQYLFDSLLGRNDDTEDGKVIDWMTTMWTDFAKYGNPTPETSVLFPVERKPATKAEQFSLEINSELTLVRRPEHARMAFWDLFYKLYGKYQMWFKDSSE